MKFQSSYNFYELFVYQNLKAFLCKMSMNVQRNDLLLTGLVKRRTQKTGTCKYFSLRKTNKYWKLVFHWLLEIYFEVERREQTCLPTCQISLFRSSLSGGCTLQSLSSMISAPRIWIFWKIVFETSFSLCRQHHWCQELWIIVGLLIPILTYFAFIAEFLLQLLAQNPNAIGGWDGNRFVKNTLLQVLNPKPQVWVAMQSGSQRCAGRLAAAGGGPVSRTWFCKLAWICKCPPQILRPSIAFYFSSSLISCKHSVAIVQAIAATATAVSAVQWPAVRGGCRRGSAVSLQAGTQPGRTTQHCSRSFGAMCRTGSSAETKPADCRSNKLGQQSRKMQFGFILRITSCLTIVSAKKVYRIHNRMSFMICRKNKEGIVFVLSCSRAAFWLHNSENGSTRSYILEGNWYLFYCFTKWFMSC